VVLAGKGHEDYQEIHGVKHPFSDFSAARAALRAAPAFPPKGLSMRLLTPPAPWTPALSAPTGISRPSPPTPATCPPAACSWP
jgi:hypothetical protein